MPRCLHIFNGGSFKVGECFGIATGKMAVLDEEGVTWNHSWRESIIAAIFTTACLEFFVPGCPSSECLSAEILVCGLRAVS